MDSKYSYILSLFIHCVLYFGYFLIGMAPNTSFEQIRLELSKGQIPNVYFSLPKNSGEGLDSSTSSGLAGTPEAEIERFKNEIHYPAGALEQRLESDCSWELEIGANGQGRNIRTIKPCRYQVFETHFKKAVSSWKFQLPEGKVIIIPISFRVESDD
ncbi:LIC_10042 family TonB-like protein [Leptospira sarikeiensis]|uniref:TonB-dependent receptor n=1 Tax=Leptospira sarikeiensis TaxID=2484943 RepID=A0A4R9K692_9LEPT|nr:energy transducer TonB [Leptospira sarikeiensis]TGL61053.1 TonB-dependent receptor [Leptospira sarikeiensis]